MPRRRHRVVFPLVAVALGAWLVACGPSPRAAPPRPEPPRPVKAEERPRQLPSAPALRQGTLALACGRWHARVPIRADVFVTTECENPGYPLAGGDDAHFTIAGAVGGASVHLLRMGTCEIAVEARDSGLPFDPARDTPGPRTQDLRSEAGIPVILAATGSAVYRTETVVGRPAEGTALWTDVRVLPGGVDTGCDAERLEVAQAIAETLAGGGVPDPVTHPGSDRVVVTVSSQGHRIELVVPDGWFVRSVGGQADQYETEYAVEPWPPSENAARLTFSGAWLESGHALRRSSPWRQSRETGCSARDIPAADGRPFVLTWQICGTPAEPLRALVETARWTLPAAGSSPR